MITQSLFHPSVARPSVRQASVPVYGPNRNQTADCGGLSALRPVPPPLSSARSQSPPPSALPPRHGGSSRRRLVPSPRRPRRPHTLLPAPFPPRLALIPAPPRRPPPRARRRQAAVPEPPPRTRPRRRPRRQGCCRDGTVRAWPSSGERIRRVWSAITPKWCFCLLLVPPGGAVPEGDRVGAATAGFGLVPVQEPDRVPGDVPRAVGHGAHARRVPLPPVRRRREANLPVHQLHWHHQGLVLLLIHLSLISLYGDYYLVVSNE